MTVFLALSPLLLLCCGALFLLLGTEKDDATRKPFVMAMVSVSVALIACAFQQDEFFARRTVFHDMLYLDPFAWYSTTLIVAGLLLSLLFFEVTKVTQGIKNSSEMYALFLFASVGACLFANASHFLTLFLGLETMSLALYCACGSVLSGSEASQGRSAEASIKYFLLGCFSSAFLLYGLALLYGTTGSLAYSHLFSGLQPFRNSPIISLALGISLVGLLFKVGVIPYHFWLPDVYQGAPTSVTAFMASVIKGAAFCALLRFLWIGFGGDLQMVWAGPLWCIATLSMLGGNVMAVRQREVKRLLAYSSIAHGGYLLTALLATSSETEGATALLYYLVLYALMTLSSFGALQLIVASSDDGDYDISSLQGKGLSHPFLGVCLSFSLLGLAGLPPAIGGLTSKLLVFSSLIKSHYTGLAILALLSSVVGCYYYLKVIVALYTPRLHEAPTPRPQRTVMQLLYYCALLLCVIGSLTFGVIPSMLYDRASVVMANLQGSTH
jgi:NADH-quinone oxidoreductase subunit N